MKIFFDFDGTIVDTSEGIINAVFYAFEKYGIKNIAKEEVVKNLIGPPLHQGLSEFTKLPSANVECLVVLFREYYSKEGVFQNKLYEGIKDVLEYFKKKGYSLNIISSKPERFIHKILNQHKIEHFFQIVNGAGEKDKKSTKHEKIKILIKDKNLKHVMIGDRAEDIEAGKKNGIFTIGVTYGYGTFSELKEADFVANTTFDIKSFVGEINGK